ncbi:DUF2345 domain-containing protein, partial [Paraburkholderia sp. J94]|uniref:DUF2345 domain-containing protein n=1 Tax=Paraburkholderia sp. J94 TaxID=2805441 RepID=UPI002AB1BF5B
ITVGRDYSLSAGRSMYASVVGSISLFAYRDGMKFFSAQGPVQIQAQGGPMSFKALGDVEVTSSEGRIIINAKDELWLGAGGSFIQINGRGIVNGSPGPILEKGANWKKAEAATMYPRLTAFATHPITFSCDSMAALEQGTATVPPVPMGAAAAPGGSPSSPSAGGGGGTSGVLEQGCTWHQASVVADMRPLNVQSGDYWAVKRNGSPYVIGGQQLFVSYSGYAGRAEFRYDEAGTEIIATVRILILPMDMKESDATGSSVSVPYSADKDQYPNLYPSRQRVPRPVQAISGFLMSAKTKIERVFNDRSHKITTADCPKGNACQCRIPVKFIVEFLTDDPGGIAHATVHLYPKALRADAGSWGEKVTYLDGNNVEHDYPQTQEYVHAHEVGHLFGFPDEYYWDAGAVHKDYIDQSRHLKLTLAQSNPRTDVWQGCTPDTLMGSGVYGNSIPKLPKYYLSQICKWFGEVNQYTWKGA